MSDSEVLLPDQLDAVSDAASSFRLPSDTECGIPVAGGLAGPQDDDCCQAGCWSCILESPVLGARVKEIQNALDAGTKAQTLGLQFSCLQHWNSVGQGNAPTGWRKYRFGGIPLCVAATCKILKLPARKFKELQTQIAAGKLTPDQSLKETQVQKEKLATQKANVLLSWLHSNVAESLVESKHKNDCSTADTLTLMRKAGAIVLGKDRLPPPRSDIDLFADMEESSDSIKWLSPGTTFAEMRDLAQTFMPDMAVSYTTFVLAYHSSWSGRLKVRSEGQHSKCTTCSRLKEFRRQCTAASDVNKVQAEYSAHIAAVMADRKFDAELNLKAQMSVGAVPGTIPLINSLLSISMDAMDCAKFKVPRHLQASKEFQNSWRPEMTMLGAIVAGVTEHYILADQDMVKNADLQCTILGLVLQRTAATLQAQGKPIPRHLRVHTDNASGEGKNQTVFYLASWLVRRKLFDSVTLSQFRVGHSHGKPDQRFSEVRHALSNSSVLEDPEAFAETIGQAVKPREGRSLEVHKVGAALEFTKFFEHLDLKTSGHTQTKGKTEQQQEAVHVFTFKRRAELSGKVRGKVQELKPPARARSANAAAMPAPDDNDIIMSCQLYVASTDDSQDPCVFAAASDFQKLPSISEIDVAPRSKFSPKQIKEFEKTAWKITQPPWNMHSGSAYLLKLATENRENQSSEWEAPDISFMLTGAGASDPDSVSAAKKVEGSYTEATFQWNHVTAAPVKVERVPPGSKARKRAAADLMIGPAATSQPAADSPSAPGAAASSSSRPQAPEAAGAPAAMFGRNGAPDRVVPPPQPKANNKRPKLLKRPAAAAAAKASPSDRPNPPPPPSPMPSLPSDVGPGGEEPLPDDIDARSSSLVLPSNISTAPSQRDDADGDANLPSSLKRPAAAPAAATPKAKPKAKAKAKAKANAGVARPQLGRLPKPHGVKLGCYKCRHSAVGCARLRLSISDPGQPSNVMMIDSDDDESDDQKGTADVELSAGTTVAGYWKGTWQKREGELRVADVPYELRDANDTVIMENKITSLGQVIKEKRAISPLEIKLMYHALVEKPTAEDSSFFKCEGKQDQQVLFRTENVPVKDEQRSADGCVTLPHGSLAGCLPTASWHNLATHVVWTVRWTARGLNPVRPLVCLKEKCIIKQGQALAFQATNPE
eukprot:s156_g14.t1